MADTKPNFSQQEIEAFVDMGRGYASYTVISYVISLVEQFVTSEKVKKRLVKKLKSVMDSRQGFVELEFNETTEKLRVKLVPVPADYITDVGIPSADYAKELIGKYNFLKAMAQAYWATFKEENADIFKSLVEAMPGVSLDDFMVGENQTTIYLEPRGEKRVGIFCYYVDRNENPFIKRNGKYTR